MMNYRNIQLPSSRILEWGKQGENKATRLSIDVSEFIERSEGTIAVSCCRPDGKKYPHDCTINDTTVEIELNSYDTQVCGILTIVVSWMCGERIVKSEIYCGEISRSISTSGENPTPPFDGLIEQVCNAAIKAKESADRAEAAADRAENIKETDPTVPAWAKQPTKPSYTADEVNARPADWKPTPQEIGAASAGDVVKLSGEITQLKGDLAAITPDDNAVDGKPWTSEKIVEALCPPFETTGSIVQCHPVEGYPLGVVSRIDATQSGTGDPSPDNIRPIVGWDSVSVTRCGKNLYKNIGSFTRFGVTFTANDDGSITVNGTATSEAFYTVEYKHALQPGTYTLSGAPHTLDNSSYLYFYPGYKSDVGDGITFTLTDAVDEYDISIYVKKGYVADNVVFRPQLELGSTATAYEPYIGDTYTAELPETVYGGELDWNTGVLTVDRRITIADGTVNKFTPDHMGTFWNMPFESAPGTIDVMGVQNSHFKKDKFGLNGYNDFLFTMPEYMNGLFDTADNLNAYLVEQNASGTPVTFVYKLKTPYTVQLTPQQIAELSGVNTLYTDAGTLTVTGREDPQHTITELKNAIISLGGNI